MISKGYSKPMNTPKKSNFLRMRLRSLEVRTKDLGTGTRSSLIAGKSKDRESKKVMKL